MKNKDDEKGDGEAAQAGPKERDKKKKLTHAQIYEG